MGSFLLSVRCSARFDDLFQLQRTIHFFGPIVRKLSGFFPVYPLRTLQRDRLPILLPIRLQKDRFCAKYEK
jgi:hypothetical protein